MKKKFLLMLSALILTLILVLVVSCGESPQTTEETTPNNVTESTTTVPNTTSTGETSSDDTSSETPVSSSTPTTSTTTSTPITSIPDDDIPEPDKGTAIKVTYEINNPYAGTITGATSQKVNYGLTKTSAVTVSAKLGYKFVGWSDGSTETTRTGDCPKQNTTYVAIFEYDALELPIISLFTDNGKDITDKKNYVTGKISVYNAPEGFNFEDLDMEIRGRGNYTWGSTFNSDPMYNKRPYRVKLSQKMNLLGQGNGKAKSWVLLANHCDQSLLRNQTVMNFAKSLSGIVWEPSATSVEVFLNGDYIGVYMLTEQVQIQENRINLSEDVESSAEIDFLLHRSAYAFDDSENISFNYDGEPYEIVSDLSQDPQLYNQQFNYIRSRIAECWDAIKYGTKEDVLELMDINSVIDTLIVHEVFKNLDTGHDNFYMFASVDSKLYFGPVWDFDQCGGNADSGTETIDGIHGSNTNAWYRNLLVHDWFKEMLQARWDELYKDDITNIPNFIREQAKACYNAYCRNFEKWQILAHTDRGGRLVLGYKINRETDTIRRFQTYTEHYEYFANWMEQRIAWLNNYYHSPQFIVEKVELNLSGKGTAASPYLITSAQDFYNFTMVMMQGENFQGRYFKQTADIDMTEISYYSGIGAPNVFAGIYDGQGHKINAEIRGGTDYSFFPYVTGTIMNLMTTGSIQNSGNAAGIARSVRVGGMIVNCGSTVKITSSGGNVGGITSSNQDGGGSIIGCWFAGTITTSSTYGPINAYVDGRATGTCKYNYYQEGYSTEDISRATTRTENETAIAQNQIAKLSNLLNNNLSAVAQLAGLDADDLCTWKTGTDSPAPVAKS